MCHEAANALEKMEPVPALPPPAQAVLAETLKRPVRIEACGRGGIAMVNADGTMPGLEDILVAINAPPPPAARRWDEEIVTPSIATGGAAPAVTLGKRVKELEAALAHRWECQLILERTVAARDARIAELEADLALWKRTDINYSDEIAKAGRVVSELEAEVARLKEANDHGNNQVNELCADLGEVRRELNDLRAQLAAADQLGEEYRQKLATFTTPNAEKR